MPKMCTDFSISSILNLRNNNNNDSDCKEDEEEMKEEIEEQISKDEVLKG